MTHTRQTALSPKRAANLAENPYAGQGPVLLDIGGDIGAVVLHLPPEWEGAEVEYEREDGTTAGDQQHEHEHEHEHSHPAHADPHRPQSAHRPHVAVVGRPAAGRVAYTAVLPDLLAGRYRLTLPDGSQLGVDVVGGEVAELDRSAEPPVA
jgi:hypothetical protein